MEYYLHSDVVVALVEEYLTRRQSPVEVVKLVVVLLAMQLLQYLDHLLGELLDNAQRETVRDIEEVVETACVEVLHEYADPALGLVPVGVVDLDAEFVLVGVGGDDVLPVHDPLLEVLAVLLVVHDLLLDHIDSHTGHMQQSAGVPVDVGLEVVQGQHLVQLHPRGQQVSLVGHARLVAVVVQHQLLNTVLHHQVVLDLLLQFGHVANILLDRGQWVLLPGLVVVLYALLVDVVQTLVLELALLLLNGRQELVDLLLLLHLHYLVDVRRMDESATSGKGVGQLVAGDRGALLVPGDPQLLLLLLDQPRLLAEVPPLLALLGHRCRGHHRCYIIIL